MKIIGIIGTLLVWQGMLTAIVMALWLPDLQWSDIVFIVFFLPFRPWTWAFAYGSPWPVLVTYGSVILGLTFLTFWWANARRCSGQSG